MKTKHELDEKYILVESRHGDGGTKIKGYLRGGISKATWERYQRLYKADQQKRNRYFDELFRLNSIRKRRKLAGKDFSDIEIELDEVENNLNRMMTYRNYDVYGIV